MGLVVAWGATICHNNFQCESKVKWELEVPTMLKNEMMEVISNNTIHQLDWIFFSPYIQ